MAKVRLVVSTGNQNKVREIKDILKDLDIEVVSKLDIDCKDIDVIEDGKTLKENSYKKAKALSDVLDDLVIADDSGLFVDYLDGKPGVHSSRYSGEEGNDEANNKKLLKELKNLPYEKRTGRFKTIITLITKNKEVFYIEGVCEGYIIDEERGENGFGYDPIFIPQGYDKTFAELGDDIKNKISHRSKALEGLKEKIGEILK